MPRKNRAARPSESDHLAELEDAVGRLMPADAKRRARELARSADRWREEHLRRLAGRNPPGRKAAPKPERPRTPARR